MLYQCSGRYWCSSTPASRIRWISASSILMLPAQSTITFTATPLRARSDSASANWRPTSPDQ